MKSKLRPLTPAIACAVVAFILSPAAVFAEAEPRFKSPVITEGSVDIDIDITGAEELWLVVSPGDLGFGHDWADWAEPRLTGPGGETKLTELEWKSATQGWGQTRVNQNADGGPLRIAGDAVEYGIGTHAPSIIHYELPNNEFTRFQARAGLDNGGTDQANANPDVQFFVFTEEPPESLREEMQQQGPQGGSLPSLTAEESIDVMTTPDGLEVTLFASEPMLVNPTNMDIDARGRVWITEGANYRSTFRNWGILNPEGDRIVILEDTTGDGRADKEITFYQGHEINAALGITVIGNQVIVARSPDVFLLTDTTGNDRADKIEKLFTGIDGVDHDHGVHAFVFGPDGKFYFNFGDNGRQIRHPNGDIVVDRAGNEVREGDNYRKGMVFRTNLDGSDFETLGHNFRNNYEVAVDSFGAMWQSDNDDDGNRGCRINFVMDHGNFGYTDEMTGAGWRTERTNMEEDIPSRHWHQNDPGVVPNLLQYGAGSPTGILVYEGDLLPEPFQNQMIHAEPLSNAIFAYPVSPDGAGYEAEIVTLLESQESWFRPSDVTVAPDGSVFVSDWHDAGVGGHNMADNNPDTMRGRIYRVAPTGSALSVQKPDFSTAESSVEALRSPNLATRYTAWMTLHQMEEDAEQALLELWDESESPQMRARGLHLLARIPSKQEEYLQQAIEDENPDIRMTALRIVREQDLNPIPYVAQVVQDPSPRVRREAALSLRHQEYPEAADLWAQLALQHEAGDRWYMEALGIGADRQETAFFAAWLDQVGDDWNTPAGRDIVWRSRGSNVPEYLVELIRDSSVSNAERPRYIRALDFIEGPEKDAALIQLITLE